MKSVRLAKFIVTAALGATFALGAMAEPLEIKVGWSQAPGHLPPLLFQKTDLMKHYGTSYTVDPIRFRGSTAQLQALATGELDLAALSATALALAVNNAKIDARVLADVIQDNAPYWSSAFTVRNDSGIKSVEDLRGKRIGTNSIGSAIDTAMRVMMRKHGMDDNDFNTIEMSFGNMPAMLAEGKVDMVPILPNLASQVDEANTTRLFTTRDAVGRQQTVSLVARAEWLEENRPAVVDFFEDYVRALQWFLDPANREEVMQIIVDFTKQPPETLEYALTENDYYRDPNGIPHVASLQNAIDISVEAGVIDKGIVAADYTDLSIIEEANARLEN